MIRGLDHVQVAAPAGCEADARRFYGALLEDAAIPGVRRCFIHDPWGNRLELVEA
jgi:hypothetical protein